MVCRIQNHDIKFVSEKCIKRSSNTQLSPHQLTTSPLHTTTIQTSPKSQSFKAANKLLLCSETPSSPSPPRWPSSPRPSYPSNSCSATTLIYAVTATTASPCTPTAATAVAAEQTGPASRTMPSLLYVSQTAAATSLGIRIASLTAFCSSTVMVRIIMLERNTMIRLAVFPARVNRWPLNGGGCRGELEIGGEVDRWFEMMRMYR